MTTGSGTRLALSTTFALLIACETERERLPSGLSAHSFKESGWSEPVPLGAPVSSSCQDQTPTLSRDELALYFMSDRLGGLGNVNPATGCLDNFDLWVARRASRESPWGTATAVNLGAVVNTSANDVAPALSVDGHLLFFSSNRASTDGLHDIYLARRADLKDDLSWGAPVALGSDVNTGLHEAGPFYLQSAEDGSGNLYFYHGSDNGATTEIYYAPVTREGETRGPAVLVSELNASGFPDGFVTVRGDGREIMFNSGRPLTPGGPGVFDMWVSTRRSVHDPWSAPVNLGAPVNSSFAEFQPDLSHDGRTLLFIVGSGRPPGGLGRFDIWMSTRTINGKEAP